MPIVERMLSYTDVPESRAFFLKMKADYKRYLVEITRGKERQELMEETKELYEKATS